MGPAQFWAVGLSARAAAAALLYAVTDRGRTLDEGLDASKLFNALEGRDRAFARAIASAALRRLGGIDHVLDGFLQKPIAEMEPNARAILRTGAAQLLAMGAPAHAAVSETVSLAKAQAPAFSGLINAVLRKTAQAPAVLDTLPAGIDLPNWLFTRWRAAYGDQAEAIALALKGEAHLDLSVKQEPEFWAERLGGVALEGNTVRLPIHGSPGVSELAGFAEGAWWVQDAAAARVAAMAGPVADLDVLDMCAAPGGKTMQLAAAGARVVALDSDEIRMARVRENLARTKLHAETIVTDARAFDRARMFNLVLLDAPCTATGTLRRHPDVAWLRRPTDITALTQIQAKLLEAAWAHVKPGGRLLYAVCSLEPEEGEGAIAAFQARVADELSEKSSITTMRTTPATRAEDGGMDGFYAAMLERRP
jgi:16S rRNA (cytosine967-C5)-methyltransferase